MAEKDGNVPIFCVYRNCVYVFFFIMNINFAEANKNLMENKDGILKKLQAIVEDYR